jgi:anti-sigma factor RsiW
MNCGNVRKRLIDFLDQKLAEGERILVGAHLLHCENCRGEKTLLEKTWSALEEFPAPAVSADFTPRLMARVRAEGQKTGFPVLIPAAAAICLAAAAGLLIWYFMAHAPQPAKNQAFVKETPRAEISEPQEKPPAPQISREDEEIIRDLAAYENAELLQNYAMLSDFEIIQNLDTTVL